MNVRKLLCELTAEEKAALVAGTDFMYTKPIPRLGIKSLRMSDGPHGLRVQAEGGDNGVTGSLPATAFPTAACTASGWNPENVRKMGKPASLMCAYNKINGEFCSHNKWLLTDVLRREWGFGGLVMTDWGAMHDRVASLRAGLNLEMPGDTAICRKWILDGLKDGTLAGESLNSAAENVLTAVGRFAKKIADDADFEANDRLACEIAEDCAVLLKNDGVLPLAEGERIFVVGDLFEKMRYQGAGSSMINPTKITSPKAAFDAVRISYGYSRGYAENQTEPQQAWIDEAVAASAQYDTIAVFAGLTDYAESEGCDREHMRLPENQLALIDALCRTGKKIVVVLFGGSPVELPFDGKVGAILNMYLPGQNGGTACANLLFGRANPSGRLAETWPLRYEDVPFGEEFGKGVNEVYRESIFVGYRYYATAKKPVRYPFGYGLSYTSFEYRGMQVREEKNSLIVSCEVNNAGIRDGAEVVQLYVRAPQSDVFKPERELRAFRKVYIKAGGCVKVELTVPKAELRYFDAEKKDWVLEGGKYELQLCSDSQTVIFSKAVRLEGENFAPYSEEIKKVYGGAAFAGLTDSLFERMSGQTIRPTPPEKPVHLESRFTDLRATFMGRILFNAVLGVAGRQLRAAQKLPEGSERDNKIKGATFMKRILESNSLMDNYGWRLGTGFLSTPMILDVLAELNTEYAYRLLENEELPGWLSMPKNGATTIWEAWEGNTVKAKGLASLNHYSKGAVCEWLLRAMCGINVAGENKFVIAPEPGGDLTYARAEYQSIYGKVSSSWERTENGWKYVISVPANTSAEIVLPDGRKKTVGAGVYTF